MFVFPDYCKKFYEFSMLTSPKVLTKSNLLPEKSIEIDDQSIFFLLKEGFRTKKKKAFYCKINTLHRYAQNLKY